MRLCPFLISLILGFIAEKVASTVLTTKTDTSIPSPSVTDGPNFDDMLLPKQLKITASPPSSTPKDVTNGQYFVRLLTTEDHYIIDIPVALGQGAGAYNVIHWTESKAEKHFFEQATRFKAQTCFGHMDGSLQSQNKCSTATYFTFTAADKSSIKRIYCSSSESAELFKIELITGLEATNAFPSQQWGYNPVFRTSGQIAIAFTMIPSSYGVVWNSCGTTVAQQRLAIIVQFSDKNTKKVLLQHRVPITDFITPNLQWNNNKQNLFIEIPNPNNLKQDDVYMTIAMCAKGAYNMKDACSTMAPTQIDW